MFLIVTSKEDVASMNILSHLMKLRDWKIIAQFGTNPVYKGENFYIATINQHHLYFDNIDKRVQNIIPEKIETVIFASRHRSASGVKTLTVHPIGNFGIAELGGKNSLLVPSSPQLMTESLRILKIEAKDLDYAVSFEATHHGPYLECPSFYVEIGSDENVWKDEVAGAILANVILALKFVHYPVAIGVGGGHYSPRITDVALERKISFGHIIPSYIVDKITPEIIKQAIDKTPEAQFVYFHRKALKTQALKRLEKWFEDFNLQVVRAEDLERLDT